MRESVWSSAVLLSTSLLAACGYPSLAQLGGGDDAGTPGDTALTGDHLMFRSGNFAVAQQQRVQLHVALVHEDGSAQDVTASASYRSDGVTLADVTATGVVTGLQAGSAMITASLAGAAPAGVNAAVRATACHPAINEVATGTAAGGPADEFVEVYNPCASTISVDGWTLSFRGAPATGALDSALLVTLAGAMAPGELRLFAGLGYVGPAVDASWPGASGILSPTSGAVGLRSGPMSTGQLVDSVAYGTVDPGNPFLETSAVPGLSNDKSAARLPFDGHDDGDGATDFALAGTPTPRALNAP